MPVAISPLNRTLLALAALGAATPAAADGSISYFTPGDLVIDTVTGNTLDAASPMTLQEFSLGAGGTSATPVGTFTLPQTQNGANSPISGEYGSASEGFLQLSGDKKYLTIMGYGVNANTFNTAAPSTYGTAALGQTTSLTGGSYMVVPRVVGLIGYNGSVDTTTALTGVFNTNNPRSAYTADSSSFYVSGQGASKTDPTQGVYYALRGATTGTPIYNLTDTRFVTVNNNTLYVSRDYNPPGSGSQNYTGVVQLGSADTLPTSAVPDPTHIVPPKLLYSSGGNNGSITLTPGLVNGVNNSRLTAAKPFVYLSPEEYFFANPTVLYVADSGSPKNGSANAAALGEGGLQKWEKVNGVWTLQYDLVAGLSLVNNHDVTKPGNTVTTPGVTGLFGLTGKVVAGGEVELFATSYGLNELSPSYLYEITDNLSFTSIDQANAAGEQFTTLISTFGTNFSIRGVSFAPAPGPVLGQGLVSLGGLIAAGARAILARRRRPDGKA